MTSIYKESCVSHLAQKRLIITSFKPPLVNNISIVTKRTVLSAIFKLFDPIEWLSPITVVAKILMQDLWKARIHWDSHISKSLFDRWSTFQSNLINLKDVHCPRWVNYNSDDEVELHGFSDASQQAYAATVYIRIRSSQGVVLTHVLAAKTRVAPIKTITIPKLELCAASLTIKLIIKIKGELDHIPTIIHAWSDSVNALSWIMTANPSR